jgi:hypothetical protein
MAAALPVRREQEPLSEDGAQSPTPLQPLQLDGTRFSEATQSQQIITCAGLLKSKVWHNFTEF